jgi:hypothetical protein
MGGYIFPEAEKVNMVVMATLTGRPSSSHTFLSHLHARTFPVFGHSWKPESSPLKILVRSEECIKVFLLQDSFNVRKPRSGKYKNITVSNLRSQSQLLFFSVYTNISTCFENSFYSIRQICYSFGINISYCF